MGSDSLQWYYNFASQQYFRLCRIYSNFSDERMKRIFILIYNFIVVLYQIAMLVWLRKQKRQALEIYEDYNDSNYIDCQNELIISQFWPLFVTIMKIYLFYSIVLIMISNIEGFESYNSQTVTLYTYLIMLLPLAMIVYDRWIIQKLSKKQKVTLTQIIFIVLETLFQLYLSQLLMEYQSLQRVIGILLIFTIMLIVMATMNNFKLRFVILAKFFIYLGYKTEFSIFQCLFTYHVVFLNLLLVYYWDQQIMRLSKIKHFAEQSLRSIPTAVCILNSDCQQVLFSNRYMKKLIDKSNTKTKTFLTKSVKQDYLFETQPSIMNNYDEIYLFFSQMFANIEEVKNQLPLDASKFNLDNNDDEQLNLNQIIQQIIKTDKKTQGKIYTLRCQFIDRPEQVYDESQKVVIEVKMKTLLQYEDNKHATLINLYDISTNLKSIYYKNLNQFKSKVIRSISHELRTRLNAIQGMIQMVQNYNQKFDREVQKYLKAAFNNCRIQNFIIGSIIDYNLLRERQLPVKPEKIRINILIQEVIDLFKDEAELKNIKIKYEDKIQTNNYELLNSERFQSILIHIISNSIRFSKSDGLISIRLLKDLSNINNSNSNSNNNNSNNNNNNNNYQTNSYIQVPDSKIQIHRHSKLQIPHSQSPQQQRMSGSEFCHDSSNNKQRRSYSKYKMASQFSSIGNLSTNLADVYLIEVKDNGLGMSTERLDQIRSLLNGEDFQVDRNSNDASSGMMLGLRASSQLIKNLSGKDDNLNYLSIDSEIDKGTIVQMHIKIRLISGENFSSDLIIKESSVENEGIVHQYHNFNQKPSPWSTVTQIHTKNLCQCENTFMIVDDEPYNLIVLESLLKKLQHQVVKAENEKMLEQFQEHKCKGYKGIIMDYQMPIMNGEEATKYITSICKDKNIPPIPIFGLTGFSGEDEINRLLESGMKEVYIKPITIRTLEDLISNISKSEYRSLDYVSNISQQFQFMDIEYAEEDKLVLEQSVH
ncbi:unnamed protein product [Paramecium octaurelia]|uniref:Uncharacterized protein n=1 Tax=Paramecium octaurelia TaxID=43137 RepID=A0A8S1XXM7_PAROT|nr:unnamed protein product [Paramecium octaurelia]